jgi:hypothetical protein
MQGIKSHKKQGDILPEELPTYTILLPLYKEDKIIKKLINSISKIDYPAQLLDVKLLLEEDDTKVLEILESISLPSYFEKIIVPNSLPKTKPKACNYGLKFAKGKYVVIYDAEDRPSLNQLKQVVAKFAVLGPEVVCIQAKLNYYNRQDNYLTQLFSIEYSLLFDFILEGLERLKMPIPLGGTSNHFITKELRELGGWDAFNVTEDADLGFRLYSKGYRCELIGNTTLEESPISVSGWLMQRSRWIKGHMLTSLLHIQQLKYLNIRQVLGIYFYLYLPNITYVLLPIYLLISCFIKEKMILSSLFYFNIALSIVLPIIYSIFVVHLKKWSKMKLSIILSPFYYLLFPIAAVRSCWQILTKPFHWDKTEHGISKCEFEE